jgi:hypothetical protein
MRLGLDGHAMGGAAAAAEGADPSHGVSLEEDDGDVVHVMDEKAEKEHRDQLKEIIEVGGHVLIVVGLYALIPVYT